MPIKVVRAEELEAGDVCGSDGYTVRSVEFLRSAAGTPTAVALEVECLEAGENHGHVKTAILELDTPIGLYVETEADVERAGKFKGPELGLGEWSRVREACRRRRRELRRSIDRAHSTRLAGGKIQEGTLERHLKEAAELDVILARADHSILEWGRRISEHNREHARTLAERNRERAEAGELNEYRCESCDFVAVTAAAADRHAEHYGHAVSV